MPDSSSFSISTPSDRELAITRVFAQPPATVFAWTTQPDLLKRWLFGPDGWSLDACDIDLRTGGCFRYAWSNDSRVKMGLQGTFLEVVEPERIVHTEEWDDPWYEGEAIITSVLVPHGNGTELTLTIRYDTKAIRDSILNSPMAEGMGIGYDRLAELMAAEA